MIFLIVLNAFESIPVCHMLRRRPWLFRTGIRLRRTSFAPLGAFRMPASLSKVALGGIAAEYVTFGQANGGMSDIIQLEALFEALKFDQQQTNVLLRTSVMNTVALLKEKQAAHSALVEAMSRGESVGRCIEIIEDSL